jgi:predicted phage terminase large subunit-like protein
MPTLYEFVREAWPLVEAMPFRDSWHVRATCEHLAAVTAGQIKNLLINIPPGTGKSLIAAVFWPCWEWTKDAAVRWFFASYSGVLSTRDSVRCRYLVESEWFQKNWGVALRDDQNQKTFFQTEVGGYRIATSVGGRGIGEHPDRIVADDPNKVQGVESDVQRQNVVTWWSQTMASRGVVRGARRVVIMQRLHANDLAGYILANEADDYVHLCLPMRYEPGRMVTTPIGWNDPRTVEGELLAPTLFDETAVAKLEKRLGPWGSAGQLQQRPAPRTGGLFEEGWFSQVVDFAPAEARRVRYWDKGATKDGGCPTCGVLMAEWEGRYYVEHVHRGRWSPHARNREMKAVAEEDSRQYGGRVQIWIEKEGGAAGTDAKWHDAHNLAGYMVHFDDPAGEGSKIIRAAGFSAQAEAGNVIVCRNPMRPWDVTAWVQELVQFPRALGKDQVDGTSGAFNRLANPDPESAAVDEQALAASKAGACPVPRLF